MTEEGDVTAPLPFKAATPVAEPESYPGYESVEHAPRALKAFFGGAARTLRRMKVPLAILSASLALTGGG